MMGVLSTMLTKKSMQNRERITRVAVTLAR